MAAAPPRSAWVLVQALACAALAAGTRNLAPQPVQEPHVAAAVLVQEAVPAPGDGTERPVGLDHVKKMIRRMIDQRTLDLSESVSRKEFCSSELPKAKAKLAGLRLRLERRTADRDELEAQIAELGDSTSELQAAVAEARRAMAHEADVRSREREAFEEEGRALPPSHAVGADVGATAQDGRLQAATAEASRDLAFRRRQQEGLGLIRQKTEAAQHNQAAMLKKRSELSNANRDKQELEERLASAESYEAQIERQCLVRPEPQAERARRRHAEIQSLKDAYTILAG